MLAAVAELAPDACNGTALSDAVAGYDPTDGVVAGYDPACITADGKACWAEGTAVANCWVCGMAGGKVLAWNGMDGIISPTEGITDGAVVVVAPIPSDSNEVGCIAVVPPAS